MGKNKFWCFWGRFLSTVYCICMWVAGDEATVAPPGNNKWGLQCCCCSSSGFLYCLYAESNKWWRRVDEREREEGNLEENWCVVVEEVPQWMSSGQYRPVYTVTTRARSLLTNFCFVGQRHGGAAHSIFMCCLACPTTHSTQCTL